MARTKDVIKAELALARASRITAQDPLEVETWDTRLDILLEELTASIRLTGPKAKG